MGTFGPATHHRGVGGRAGRARLRAARHGPADIQEAPALNLLLARGWAVAVPDHLGPNSAYGAPRRHANLDGIRAVKRFGPADLAGSPVGSAGYSGGGMATGFAAAMAPEYAPELPIVGVAQGGVPVNIGKLASDVGAQPSPLFGLGFAAAIGLEREYPAQLAISVRPLRGTPGTQQLLTTAQRPRLR